MVGSPGPIVGSSDGSAVVVGTAVGLHIVGSVGSVGISSEGASDGFSVGILVGYSVGDAEGSYVGISLGDAEGSPGPIVGSSDGSAVVVGTAVGLHMVGSVGSVGISSEGAKDGDSDGCSVGL